MDEHNARYITINVTNVFDHLSLVTLRMRFVISSAKNKIPQLDTLCLVRVVIATLPAQTVIRVNGKSYEYEHKKRPGVVRQLRDNHFFSNMRIICLNSIHRGLIWNLFHSAMSHDNVATYGIQHATLIFLLESTDKYSHNWKFQKL